ncbi:B-cell scaffold protein with ankyrin repeats-like isoform X2 [Genypterus blacodes]|uniref:B-cell scaffold protein with ankyrin repeats-like isoform X2 n=1 Tax=Genypterus blacodes TaxID=154954 RepID=UPI003F75AD84
MSQKTEDLLIIYEAEAEQWATYLHSVFTGPIPDAGICCYDITTVSTRLDDFLRLAKFKCKLLILSKGMVECLCQLRRFFLSRVLYPAAHVVVLLCGVESLAPLLQLIPLNSDECLQISSTQEPDEYLPAVIDIVRRGASATAANMKPTTSRSSVSEQKLEEMQSSGVPSVRSSIVVVPCRVLCGGSMEVFILLKDETLGNDTEIEFSNDSQMLRVKPFLWNELTLCVNAPDFPPGIVSVTLFSDGVPLSKTQLHYYSTMEETADLLLMAADPVDFMCQALQVSSVEMLDQKLASILLDRMPTGGFQGLKCESVCERERHHADVPSLLHFAAQYGFKSVSSILLQCPGSERALCTANHNGQIPTEIAKTHGHAELHTLLKETLKMYNADKDNGDGSVYEMMSTAGNPSSSDKEQQEEEAGEEEEDPYALFRMADKYDSILTSPKAISVANRPPAPTPRPQSNHVKEDQTPYIAQARGSVDSISSTYDTFMSNQTPALTELQQKVKLGSVAVDDALNRFTDGLRVQKGAVKVKQDKLHQLRASIINNREDDDSVYDKINIVHHTPSVSVIESQSGNQQGESDYYSKPLKGQNHKK